MNITVDKQPNCTATLRVEVPSDAVNSERERIFKAYASQAKIQGFRPGKAPRKVIESRFKDSISEELQERLVRKAYDEDGMTIEEFDTYGATVRTLRGFIASYHELTRVIREEFMLPNPDVS